VIAAVDGGATRHAAAERFGIGVATAIRWLRAWRDEGRLTALPMGGDVRSHRIEAFGDVILAAVKAQKDITLAELANMLHHNHGASFASSTIWRFLDRLSSSPLGARPGSTPSLTSIRCALCSSTKPGLRRRWPGSVAGPSAASDAGPASRTGIGRRQPLSAHSASKA